jgi:hypothetical protein
MYIAQILNVHLEVVKMKKIHRVEELFSLCREPEALYVHMVAFFFPLAVIFCGCCHGTVVYFDSVRPLALLICTVGDITFGYGFMMMSADHSMEYKPSN